MSDPFATASRVAVARAQADATPVTVRQILATSGLAEKVDVLAGTAGLDRTVRNAAVGVLGEALPDPASLSGTLLVLDSRRLRADSYQIDMTLRAASDAAASGLILCGPRTLVALAALRFADKISLPLAVAADGEPLILADIVRRIACDPLSVRTQTFLAALEALQRSPARDPVDSVMRALGPILNGDVAVIGGDGTVVAGVDEASPAATSKLLEVPSTITEADWVFVTQPLSLAAGERPSYWIVARLPSPTATWKSLVVDVLSMSAWFVASRLVADRLQRERDARFRLGVLNSIVSGQDRPEPVLLEQFAVLGWQADGWCTAVHLQASGEVDPLQILTLTDELSRQLHATGVHGPLIERPDGWNLWVLAKDEPLAASASAFTAAVRRAIERFTQAAPRLRLHAGIGRAHYGLVGLRASLAESKEAATIAQAAGNTFGVQHIDEMGVRRILLGWYASDSFAEFAHTLLGPVLAVDPGGELLMTLETYLDSESSATLAAAELSVHRNTVLNRVDRLRSLLTVNLDDPDERLAVQLACRVVKLRRAEASGAL